MERISDKDMDYFYSYLYSHAVPNHAIYGAFDRRAINFHEWIKPNVPEGSSILEAGCGRGFLLRWLIAEDYKAEGTEIADFLLNPGGDLYGMPVRKLYYNELGQIQDSSFDVVLSSDVIEHLQSEEDVVDGLKHLVRISRGPVLVSTGGLRQAHNPFPKVVKLYPGLHLVVRPKEWWKELYEKYCNIDKEFESVGSYFLFGRKK